MSMNVDERVVEMRFDNKQFESGAKETMTTLEKLKAALNFDGVEKNFEKLEKAASDTQLSGIASAVEELQARFSTMGIVGMRVVENLTDSLIGFVRKGVNFATDAIISGGIRRAMNIENAHFQLQSLLKDEEKVTNIMNSANKSVDGTAYSYDVAARSASMFAASGVKMGEQMDNALAAVADATASVNGNYERMALIFTQVSGQGRLMGNDLLQFANAGMNVAATLVNYYKDVKNMKNVTEAEVRDMVSKGKVSFQDLADAIEHTYAGAAKRANETINGAFSNVKAAFARIGAGFISPLIEQNGVLVELLNAVRLKINDVKKAVVFDKELGNFNALSKQFTDQVSKMASAVTKFINDLDISGPMEKFYYGLEIIKNTVKALGSVIKPLVSSFKAVFGSIDTDAITNLLSKLQDITSSLILTQKHQLQLRIGFRGLFDIIKLVADSFMTLLKVFIPFETSFKTSTDAIFDFIAKAGYAMSNFAKWATDMDFVGKAVQAFRSDLLVAQHYIENNFGPVIDKIREKFAELKESLKEKFGSPGIELIHVLLEKLHERMSQIFDVLSKIKVGTVTIIEAIVGGVKDSNIPTILEAIWNGLVKIGSAITGGIGSGIKAFFNALSSANYDGFLDILNSLSITGIFAAIKAFLGDKKLIDLVKSLNPIGDLIKGIDGNLKSLQKCLEAYQDNLKADVLIKIAVAIAILTTSLVEMSLIDSSRLQGSIQAISLLMGEMMGAFAILSKIDGMTKQTQKSANVMLILSASVLILAGAVKSLSDLDSDQIEKGIIAIGAMMGELLIFVNYAEANKGIKSAAFALIELAAALKILVSVMKEVADMEMGDIIKGAAAIGVLITELTVFTNLAGSQKRMVGTGLGLIELAAALKILVSVLKAFGEMSWEEIGKGLTVMGVALAEVAIAMNLLPKDMVSKGLGLIEVGASLSILAEVLNKFGQMDWEQLIIGLGTISVLMLELALGLNAMNGTLAGSAAMLIASAALLTLTPVLAILGAMSWESIVKGLVAIAGAFTILGVAGLLLTPVVGSIVALSASLALIGVSVITVSAGLLLLGASLSAIAIGIAALGASFATGSIAIVSAIGVILQGIVGLSTELTEALKTIIIVICTAITEATPVIGETIKTLVLTLVDVLVECVPALVEGALTLIKEVFASLAENIGPITNSIFDIVITLINTLAERMPELIKAVVDVIMALFSGVIEAMKDIDVEVLVQGIAGIGIMSAIMVALAALAALAPAAMIGVLAMAGVVVEMIAMLGILASMSEIPGLDWVLEKGGEVLGKVGEVIGNFIGGLVGSAIESFSKKLPDIGMNLTKFMNNLQPFIRGAKTIDDDTTKGVRNIVSIILLLTAAKVLDGITSFFGGFFTKKKTFADFAAELIPFGEKIVEYSNKVKGIDADAVEASANAAKMMVDLAKSLPNESGLIQKIFGEKKSLSEFAEELIKFGEKLVDYAEVIKGITPASVKASADAAQILVDLANNLPSKTGILSGLFKKNGDLEDFGKQLKSFGENLVTYGDTVSNLNIMAINNAYAQMLKLLDFSELASKIDSSGIANFTYRLADLATEGVYGFITAFEDSTEKVSEAVSKVVDAAASGIERAKLDMKTKGTELANNFLLGITTHNFTAAKTGEDFALNIINGISKCYNSFNVSGKTAIDQHFLKTVREYYSTSTSVGKQLATYMINGITSTKNQFTNIGKTLVNLFIASITNRYGEMKTVGLTFSNMFYSQLESMSKKLQKLGDEAAGNFIAGIRGQLPASHNIGNELGKEAYDGTYTYVIQFNALGADAGSGFVSGIRTNLSGAAEAGRALADAAYNAVVSQLQISSQSEVMEQLGESFREGLEKGLSGTITPTVTVKMDNSISGMTKEVQDSFNNAVNTTTAKANNTANTVASTKKQTAKSSASSNKNVVQNNNITVKESSRPDYTAKKVAQILSDEYTKGAKTWL